MILINEYYFYTPVAPGAPAPSTTMTSKMTNKIKRTFTFWKNDLVISVALANMRFSYGMIQFENKK
jgi:hypothetical protein